MTRRILTLIFILFFASYSSAQNNCSASSIKLHNYTLESLQDPQFNVYTFPNKIQFSWRINYTDRSCWTYVKFSLYKLKEPSRIIREDMRNTTEGILFFYNIDYFTDYEIRATADTNETYLGSFKKSTFGYEAPSLVQQLEIIRQPDKSLIVNWQRPVIINAPFICYYQVEVWKTAIPHSSYFIKTFTDSPPFTINNQALIDDLLTIKVFAVNTNVALNGTNCYASLNFSKTLKSNEALFYYSPPSDANSSQILRFQYWIFTVLCFIRLLF